MENNKAPEWIFWYVRKHLTTPDEEKTGVWIEYNKFKCSDGSSWPDNVRMSQYYKGELLFQVVMPVSFLDEVKNMIGRMEEHIDELAPVNKKITQAYHQQWREEAEEIRKNNNENLQDQNT